MTGLEADWVDPARYQFMDANDGSTRLWTADQVRELIAHPGAEDGKTVCRVCGFMAVGSGYGPHTQSHLRAIGDLPERKKIETKQPKRKYTKRQAVPAVDEACLALLAATVGDKIPLSMVGDVQEWVDETKKLIEALK